MLRRLLSATLAALILTSTASAVWVGNDPFPPRGPWTCGDSATTPCPLM